MQTETLSALSTLDLAGTTLILGGVIELDGLVEGPGIIRALGSGGVNGLSLSAAATLEIGGSLSSVDGITGSIDIDAGGTLSVAGPNAASVAEGAEPPLFATTIGNAGFIAATGELQLGTVSNTGSIAITQGNLTFDGVSTGTVEINGGTLGFDGVIGGRVIGDGLIALTGTLMAGVVLSAATLELTGPVALAADVAYAGSLLGNGARLVLAGHQLTLSGDSVAGQFTVGRAGVLAIAPAGSVDSSGIVLEGAVTAEVAGVLRVNDLTMGQGLNDSTTLVVSVGGLVDLGYAVNTMGTVTIRNAGTLSLAFGPLDLAKAAPTLDNTGLIEAIGGGVSTLAGATTQNNGAILIAGGATYFTSNSTLTVTGILHSGSGMSGSVDIGASGELDLLGGAAANQTIRFGPGGVLVLGAPAQLAATIIDFSEAQGSIVFDGVTATGLTYADGSLQLRNAAGASLAALVLAEPAGVTTADFTLSVTGDSTTLTTNAPCFVAGTRILTPLGEIAVEHLRVGDWIVTHDGATRPVVWTGKRIVDCRAHPFPEHVQPICIAAGALGPAEPSRRLLISPDHALYCGGSLIPAKCLVNGRSVTQADRDCVTYVHLELDRHDVIIAEGVAAESYLDCGNRTLFDETRGERHTNAMPLLDACAPTVTGGPDTAALRRRLVERLPALGYRIATPRRPSLAVATRRLRYLGKSGNWLAYRVPPECQGVLFGSESAIPAEIDPRSDDQRRLGVAISGIEIGGAMVALDDHRLDDGWHPMECEGDLAWRWSNGAAQISSALWVGYGRSFVLRIRIVAQRADWVRCRPKKAVNRNRGNTLDVALMPQPGRRPGLGHHELGHYLP